MNVFSTARLTALVLGLSLSAMACSQEPANEDGAASGAAFSEEIHAGPLAQVSMDGTGAARAVMAQTARILSDEVQPSAAVLDFLATSYDATFVHREAGRTTYYLVGSVLEDTDHPVGSKTLVIEQTSPHPFMGPAYAERLFDGEIPKGAVSLGEVDASAVKAMVGIAQAAVASPDAPAIVEVKKFIDGGAYVDDIEVQVLSASETSFKIRGGITYGGDEVVGDAYLDIVEHVNTRLADYNIVGYTAKTRIDLGN